MNSIRESTKAASVTYKQLGVVALFFVLGIVATLLFSNVQGSDQTSFSTTELVSFTLSVVLASASIVLAISAIALGRSSEQAVITRSDESIRLQNEIFTKTTEALNRIESSTGVTEKRIEDIISGRAGDISHRIAQLASSGGKGWPTLDAAELEKEIRKSIISEIGDRKGVDESEQEKKAKDRMIRYEEFHQLVLMAFANKDSLHATKLGHGKINGAGDDLYDGIFRAKDGTVLGVSSFQEQNAKAVLQLRHYIEEVAKSLIAGQVNKVILAFDAETDRREAVTDAVNKMLEPFKGNPADSIQIVTVPKEDVARFIGEELAL